MNPRDFLRETGYPIAVLTTYSFDPFFFERLVLPDLWAGGSGSVLVFVDQRELDRSLASVVGGLRHLGRRYFLQPVEMAGAFHAKVFLRLGDERGLAWVGTNNLTRGGWGANTELGAAWMLGNEQSDRAWVAHFLEHLQRSVPTGLAGQLLERARGVQWLRTPSTMAPSSVLVSSRSTLREQVERRWVGRRFSSLKVLTGSTDSDAGMLAWAVEQFGLESIQLCVTPERASLDADALARLGIDVRIVAPPEEKVLHAKLYWFDGGDGPAAIWGSANCSRAAWLLEAHNLEAVVIDDHPDPGDYQHILDVFADRGVAPSSVLFPESGDVRGGTGAGSHPLRLVRAKVDLSGVVSLEVSPSIPEDGRVWLERRGERTPLHGDGAHWNGFVEDVGSARYSDIVRIVAEFESAPAVRSAPHWLDREHELREVLAGRDFRTSMDRLRTYESKAADYRLAHELGRIGLELLHDGSAYPDVQRPRASGAHGKGDSCPRVDSEALLVSLAQRDAHVAEGAGGHTHTGAVTGVFRALFAREGEHEDSVMVDEGDGESGPSSPPKPTPPEEQRRGGQEADADEKAQKILRKHMEKFFQEFEDPHFVDVCTAVQLAQASAYPIAVALMGERRRWCSAEDREAWVSRALRSLLKNDRFHRRDALLETVRRRYDAEDRHDQFEAAIGDGHLWLVLVVACAMLPARTNEDILTKVTLFRELLARQELLATAELPAMTILFRSYYDPETIEAARSRVAHVGAALREVEEGLNASYDGLKVGQLEAQIKHHVADLVWSAGGGWGLVVAEQKGDSVEAFAVQAGQVKKFKAHGWFVNTSQLADNPQATVELRSRMSSFLAAMNRHGKN